MESLHQGILPWPFDTLNEDEVRSIAHKGFDDTVNALLKPGQGTIDVGS
jgi:hypothetical protein